MVDTEANVLKVPRNHEVSKGEISMVDTEAKCIKVLENQEVPKGEVSLVDTKAKCIKVPENHEVPKCEVSVVDDEAERTLVHCSITPLRSLLFTFLPSFAAIINHFILTKYQPFKSINQTINQSINQLLNQSV